VISSFNALRLHVLRLPGDIELGEIEVDPAPFDTLPSAGATVGALAMPQGAAADVFFLVNGTFDANFAPKGSSAVGTLAVDGDLP
jgi:hypothetical protein